VGKYAPLSLLTRVDRPRELFAGLKRLHGFVGVQDLPGLHDPAAWTASAFFAAESGLLSFGKVVIGTPPKYRKTACPKKSV
jgi:hypothetical protein